LLWENREIDGAGNRMKTGDNKGGIKRRHFLAGLGGILFGLNAAKGMGSPRDKLQGAGRSRIVVVRGRQLRDRKGRLRKDKVRELLDEGMKALFDVKSPNEAWRGLLDPRRDVIGLKVNCLAGRGMSTSPELSMAIANSLIDIGVDPERIIIWDRLSAHLKRAGYRINTSGRGIRCFGTDAVGLDNRLVVYRSIGSIFSRIITDYCSTIINVPILKDHSITGLTAALKNYFGAIHNPNKYHKNFGDPYIADLNAHPLIREKDVITICDAFTCQYNGGPSYVPHWSWNYDSLIIGIDPVAVDCVGWQIIDEKRVSSGLGTLEESGRKPSYIDTAADSEHKIGISDPSRIDIIRLEV